MIPKGRTALHWAAYNGHDAFIEWLTTLKPHPDLTGSVITGDGEIIAKQIKPGELRCIMRLIEAM